MFQAIGILLFLDIRKQLRWISWLALLFTVVSIRPLFAQEAQKNAGVPTATVVTAGLNIRSGPGLDYAIVGYLRQNQSVPILGQAENCRWLKISLANAKEGWISGKPAYISINVDCSVVMATAHAQAENVVPVVANNPLPQTTPPAVKLPVAAATPTPLPPTQQLTQTAIEFTHPPAGQGCYLLQNRLGPPITVTFTDRANGKSIQILVPHGAEVAQCLVAGEYTYTISAVGFKDKNGEMKVIAGDAYLLPIEW